MGLEVLVRWQRRGVWGRGAGAWVPERRTERGRTMRAGDPRANGQWVGRSGKIRQ